MIELSSPRENVRAAFKTILDDADLPLGVTVHERMPYEGAEERSVVLTVVSGSSRHGALGDQTKENARALEEQYRIQIDCYHDDQEECGKMADAVEQAIVDNLDTLASDHDIHNVRKIVDTDTLPPQSGARESRVLMDFEFYTHRELT